MSQDADDESQGYPVAGMNLGALLQRLRRHGPRAAWAVVDQGSLPISQLVLTPILLARLGRPGFGLWALSATILGMSQLLSVGAGMATTRHVAADLAKNDRPAAIQAIRAALTIAVAGSLTACLVAAEIAPAVAGTLLAQMGSPPATARVLFLSVIAAAVQEIDAVFSGALRGAERFDIAARIEAGMRIVMVMALTLLVTQSPNVTWLLVGLIGMIAGKAVVKAWRVAKLLGSPLCCLPSFAAGAVRRMLLFGTWHWVQTAGSVLFSAADQLLVGGMFGAAALAGYSVCLQVAQVVHLLPSVMLQIVVPRVSALGTSLDAQRSNEILRAATLFAISVAALLAIAEILCGPSLLRHWIGADFAAENRSLLVALVLAHLLLAANIGPYFVLLGSGRPAVSARVVVLAGGLQATAAVLLAPLGLVAVACSRFVYALATSTLYPLARYPTRGS